MFEIDKIHYNLSLLDLLYNYQLINGNQYRIISKLKKYYGSYTEGKITPSYKDRIKGGKVEDNTEKTFDKSRKWLKIIRLYKQYYNFDINIFTEDLFIDKQTFYFINYYNVKFYDFLCYLVENIDKITFIYYKIFFKKNKK